MSWLKKMFVGAESMAFLEGRDAYEAGDYATAIAKFTPLVEAGHTSAQCALGMMYAAGRGVDLNWEKAVELFHPAAEAGIPEAQFNLALAYAKGDGVLQDGCIAYVWAALAAAQNFGDAPNMRDAFADNMPPEKLAEAQYSLGWMYANGKGVPRDDAEAVRWYRLAAEAGDAIAQHNLALKYKNGGGVPQDYAEAVRWFSLAAKAGLAESQSSMGTMYAEGKGVPQDYAEALKWWRLAAEAGNAIAQFNLGLLYSKGDGVSQDYCLAYMWFNISASQGDGYAKAHCDKLASEMPPKELVEAGKMAEEMAEKIAKNQQESP